MGRINEMCYANIDIARFFDDVSVILHKSCDGKQSAVICIGVLVA